MKIREITEGWKSGLIGTGLGYWLTGDPTNAGLAGVATSAASETLKWLDPTNPKYKKNFDNLQQEFTERYFLKRAYWYLDKNQQNKRNAVLQQKRNDLKKKLRLELTKLENIPKSQLTTKQERDLQKIQALIKKISNQSFTIRQQNDSSENNFTNFFSELKYPNVYEYSSSFLRDMQKIADQLQLYTKIKLLNVENLLTPEVRNIFSTYKYTNPEEFKNQLDRISMKYVKYLSQVR